MQLLRLVHARMAAGAALLVGEMLLYSREEERLHGGQPGPEAALLQDLNMLVSRRSHCRRGLVPQAGGPWQVL